MAATLALPLTSVINVSTDTIAGRATAGTGALEALTPAQARAVMDVPQTSHTHSLSQITQSGATDNQVATWDNATGAWVAETPAAGGDVSKVGTPVDNQVAVWTGDGTIEGTADLTVSAGYVKCVGIDTGTTGVNFGLAGYDVLRSGTGIVFRAGGYLAFQLGGVTKFSVAASGVTFQEAITGPSQFLSIRNGTNPQQVGLFETYTDNANYSRCTWQAQAGGDFRLITQSAGTGTRRSITIDPAAALTVTKPVQLADQVGDPTLSAGYSAIYGKDVTSSNEVFVKDEAGNVTQISPHASDGPPAIYSATPGLELVLGSYNVYNGTIKWVNLENPTILPISETFAEYNARRGLTARDPEFKEVVDPVAEQTARQEQRTREQADFDSVYQAELQSYRQQITEWKALPSGRRVQESIPVFSGAGQRPADL